MTRPVLALLLVLASSVPALAQNVVVTVPRITGEASGSGEVGATFEPAPGIEATFSGILHTFTTSTCTAANTTETNLWTYSLPPGTLEENGAGIWILVWGNTGGNANGKTERLYFGATELATTNSQNANNKGWALRGHVLRTGATAQVAMGESRVQDIAENGPYAVTPAETMANAITIRMSGQNGTATANDICVKGAIVGTIK